MKSETITNSPEWSAGFVSGLVCGEGSFTIAICKSKTSRLGYHVRALFQIELHRSDEALLLAVRDFFGFGTVYYPAPRTRVVLESPTCRYAVTSINDNLTLAAFFRANPLVGAKQKSLEIWAQCLGLMAEGKHTHSEGFRQIAELRSHINQYRRPSTYREFEVLDDAPEVETANRLSSWTPTETATVEQYVKGEITRAELSERVGRVGPSLDNKISRVRKALKARSPLIY